MNILLVTDAYPPEIRSASHLMQELAEELQVRGHSITVITCYPKYNLADSGPDIQFDECTDEGGIRVIRVNTLPHHKVNFIVRGISQLSLPFIFSGKVRKYLKDGVDAVIVYSPPLPLWQVGRKVKHWFNARFVLNIQDIFPQNAIDLGALKHSFIIRYFEAMEKKAYASADIIALHSNNNSQYLIREKGVDAGKVHTLHNWIDLTPAPTVAVTNKFRKHYGLENKFIVFFGGVLGPSQGLDMIIEAAHELREEKDIAILLVGDGTEKKRLEELAQSYSLANVVFGPFISRADYQELLREVDVGLVSLTSKNKTPVVPGKIPGYMGASLPVLAFLNKESDGHQMIHEAGCGYSATYGDPHHASRLMLKMYEERQQLKSLGKRGFRYAEKHFSKEVCIDQLEEILR